MASISIKPAVLLNTHMPKRNIIPCRIIAVITYTHSIGIVALKCEVNTQRTLNSDTESACNCSFYSLQRILCGIDTK